MTGKDLLIVDLKKRINSLERELEETSAKLKQSSEQIESLQYIIDETRKSFSYRLGYAITGIPRKLRKKRNSL